MSRNYQFNWLAPNGMFTVPRHIYSLERPCRDKVRKIIYELLYKTDIRANLKSVNFMIGFSFIALTLGIHALYALESTALWTNIIKAIFIQIFGLMFMINGFIIQKRQNLMGYFIENKTKFNRWLSPYGVEIVFKMHKGYLSNSVRPSHSNDNQNSEQIDPQLIENNIERFDAPIHIFGRSDYGGYLLFKSIDINKKELKDKSSDSNDENETVLNFEQENEREIKNRNFNLQSESNSLLTDGNSLESL